MPQACYVSKHVNVLKIISILKNRNNNRNKEQKARSKQVQLRARLFDQWMV